MRKFIEIYKNGNEEGFEAASMVNVISEFDVSSKKLTQLPPVTAAN